MKTRPAEIVLLVLVICASRAARAEITRGDGDQPPGRNPPKVAREGLFVSVLRQHTGEPILVIKYPWKRHAHPSVEVRILDETEVDNPLIRPLFFGHDVMKGNITMAVYHCQDRSEDVPQTATFSQDRTDGKIDFEIFGARNLLGRPAVCVASLTTIDNQPPKTRAAFCLLDAWAIDQRTLYLELPEKYFPERCKIRVWFLRGKDVVWMANATWPGTAQ